MKIGTSIHNASVLHSAKYELNGSRTFLVMIIFLFQPCGEPAELIKCSRKALELGVYSKMYAAGRDILQLFLFQA